MFEQEGQVVTGNQSNVESVTVVQSHSGSAGTKVVNSVRQSSRAKSSPNINCSGDVSITIDGVDISSRVCSGAAKVQVNTVSSPQNALMRYCPKTGKIGVSPTHAAQYRDQHGAVAWLFNPWNGQQRDNADIATDMQGLLIHA